MAQLALEVAGRLGAWLWRRTRSARVRRSFERRYLQSVIDRYQQWGRDYVALRGTAEAPAGALGEDISVHPAMYVLVEHEHPGENRPPSPRPERDSRVKVELSRMLEESAQLALVGEPGSGKTTHLRWLALKQARLGLYSLEGECTLPVFIHLGGYTGSEAVVDFVKGCLRDEYGVGGSYVADNLVQYLDLGRLLFLLDGLNQMPAERYSERVDRLRRFADGNPRNKFVFSCRVLDYEQRFRWPRVLIAPLDDEQIEEFIENYLPQIGGELRDQLMLGDDALVDLARNPFMLRTMILIYQQFGALPASRARLLKQLVAVLLARERGEQWLRTADGDAFLETLGRLAFVMVERGEVGTTVDRDWIKSALASAPGEWDSAAAFAVTELIKLGADASLLEVSRGEDRIRFYHELLQEYLGALVLQMRYELAGDLLRLFRDCWWEQTAPMVCGLIDAPDPLVLSILEGLGSEGGALLAGTCCAETASVLRQDTVERVVRSLQALAQSGIGPLGIRAMDLIAMIAYSTIEDMVLNPDPHTTEHPEVQMVRLLGARYAGIVPIYMGPFYWATRDRTWEPRAYAASLVRTLGSQRIGEALLGVLNHSTQSLGLEVMILAVLADMRHAEAAEAFVWVLSNGSYQARIHAARGLGTIGAAEAEPVLTRSLLDPGEGRGIREACGFALAQIRGPEFVESLAHDSRDTELQEIVHYVLSELKPPTRLVPSREPDETQLRIAALSELPPEDLLGKLTAVYGRWGAESYSLAAALALRSDESFVPELEAAMQAVQCPADYHAHGEYKLREALWWTIDAIRERRRRRGRPPRLSPSPRDWSAFGAPPR